MKIEINTELLSEIKLDANIYLILYMLYVRDSRSLMTYLKSVGKVPISTFEKLLQEGYIALEDIELKYIPSNVIATEKTKQLFIGNQTEVDFNKLFEEITKEYPKVVTKGFKKRRLQTEKDNCRIVYKKFIASNNEVNLELHNQIIKAIRKEVEEKKRSDDLILMTGLIVYLRNKGWEAYLEDEEISYKSNKQMI